MVISDGLPRPMPRPFHEADAIPTNPRLKDVETELARFGAFRPHAMPDGLIGIVGH